MSSERVGIKRAEPRQNSARGLKKLPALSLLRKASVPQLVREFLIHAASPVILVDRSTITDRSAGRDAS